MPATARAARRHRFGQDAAAAADVDDALACEPAARRCSIHAETQRIDLVQRPEHRCFGIPPVMRERARTSRAPPRRRCRRRGRGYARRGHCSSLLPKTCTRRRCALVDASSSSRGSTTRSPADPYVGHRIAAERMDEMRDRIVARDGVDAGRDRRRRCRPALPGASEPIAASSPSARAPPSVAMRSDACGRQRRRVAGRDFGEQRARGAFRRRGRAGCCDAAPSVPSATLTPRASSAATGRDAAAELHVRRRAMHDVAACVASSSMSSPSRCTPWMAMKPGPWRRARAAARAASSP